MPNKPTYTVNKYIQLGISFDIFQKRVIHFVVQDLQKEIYVKNDAKSKKVTLKGQEKQELRSIRHPTIEGDCYFYIPVELIDPKNQHTKLQTSLRKLKKPIDREGLVADFLLKAERKNKQWVLLFPKESVDFLTEVSRGVTPLQTLVYLTAQSSYTIRFYELLMQYRTTGKWYTTPEDLYVFLDASPSYRKNFGRFKQSVVNVAQKELRELYKKKQSEVCFEYTEKRGGRGNKVQSLIFTIFWREKKNKEEQKNEDLEAVTTQLERLMITEVDEENYKEKNKEFINKALSVLIQDNCLKEFGERLEKIITNPKIKDKGGYIRNYLILEYGVE